MWSGKRPLALNVIPSDAAPPNGLAEVRPERRRTVILLSLDWTRPKDPRTPLGQASLLAALREAGQVEVIGLSESINRPDFLAETVVASLLRHARQVPDGDLDIAIGVYVWNDAQVRSILSQLRLAGCKARMILGGPQISYSGPGLEQFYPEADVFVRGYGERALVAVTATDRRHAIDGVHWAGSPDEVLQAQVDLATLPSPFLTGVVDVNDGQRFVRWETQRGCRYSCTFCQHREAGARLQRRQLDIARIRDEIALFARLRVQEIAVLDPIFNDGPDYLDILGEFRRQSYGGRLSLQCRFELVNDAFLDACQALNVHLEFGLQTIHPQEYRAIQRGNRRSRVEQVIAELHHRAIDFEVSLIFGLPNQTLASFRDSVDFCLKWRVPTIRAFPLMLLRGTKLERERDTFGLIENEDPIPAVVSSHSFDVQDWRRMASIAAALSRSEGQHPAEIAGLDVAEADETAWSRRFSPQLPTHQPSVS